jgi:hypothetical protein
MKDKSIAYAIYMALGLAVIGIFILVVLPMIRDMISDADDTRPAIPTSAPVLNDGTETNLVYSLPSNSIV